MENVYNKPDLQSLQKEGARTYKNSWDNSDRGQPILGRFLKQIDDYHLMDQKKDIEIEEILLKQQQYELDLLKNPKEIPTDVVRFSPSGASKCSRELFFSKLHLDEKDSHTTYPYQRRWQNNGSKIHERIQQDLLYSSKMVPNSPFYPYMLPSGLPAWEKAILRYKRFEHNGQTFAIYGMGDGILIDRDDEQIYGFEYKTKSTSVAAIGDFKLRNPESSHLIQIYCYFELFENLKGYILLYESLAKDGWNKKELAKPDLKAFFIEPSEEEQTKILDKFARVSKAIKDKEVPEKELDKCIFCPFKTKCAEVG